MIKYFTAHTINCQCLEYLVCITLPTGRTIIPELNLAPAPRLVGGKLVDSKFDVDYSRSSKTTAYSTSK